jgi:hypothetical protein
MPYSSEKPKIVPPEDDPEGPKRVAVDNKEQKHNQKTRLPKRYYTYIKLHRT